MVSNISPWGVNLGTGSYFFDVDKKGGIIRGGVIRGNTANKIETLIALIWFYRQVKILATVPNLMQ